MDHLTKEQLADLKQRLDAERSSLLRREIEHRADTTDPLTPDVGDQQDHAANEAAQVAQLSIADHDRSRLREVEDALARMQAGTYGICEDTEEEIPFERLSAQPTARLTVEAQEIREREARERAELREAY
ncbi:TraR/DksA family transcriptional regulator [Nannocystis bainbridge]|uniref:TraR/DksA family transcriptional regulator n=1 Tax=Nannocystis bainbridge TaxID=2995303 RepID=A0ABT5DXM4_9BACT|nr:TraR/DksA family transcriptional regulator [Nannocystis bainbridge]MDC0718305.1 TraR/DksA family transcriptional regulator [Nannocystis bainbridge]